MSVVYHTASVRRQDRLLDESLAMNLLREGEYGVLSMCDENTAYGIPVNYVWDGQQTLYVHCAPHGRKMQAIRSNALVSFCVVGKTQVVSSQFTTRYESILLEALAKPVESDQEKRAALGLFLKKYSPDDLEVGQKYIEKSLYRTAVIRLDILFLSGKRKK